MSGQKKFDRATAQRTAEFRTFTDAVAKFLISDGKDVEGGAANEREVSCPWEAFVNQYELSNDVLACVQTIRRRPGGLEDHGLSWSNGSKRFTALRPAGAAAAVTPPAPRNKKTDGEYTRKVAKRKFSSTEARLEEDRRRSKSQAPPRG